MKAGRKAGYSLVEVTLAILVVGLGMVTAFGLFSAALTLSQQTNRETRAALFAQEVLDGFRACLDGDPIAWANAHGVQLEAACYSMWSNAPGIRVQAGSGVKTNLYFNYVGGLEYAVRYELTFSDVEAGRIKGARLRVWPGEFGSANPGDALEFYTEFYNWRVPLK